MKELLKWFLLITLIVGALSLLLAMKHNGCKGLDCSEVKH